MPASCPRCNRSIGGPSSVAFASWRTSRRTVSRRLAATSGWTGKPSGNGATAARSAAFQGWSHAIPPSPRLAPETLRLLEHAQRELEYGAARTQVWLLRVHQIRLPRATIQHAFRRLGLPRLPRRRKRSQRPRQLRLFEKPEPGDCIQIDVKHVKVHGQRAYQYSALDDCTRVRVLRLYRHLSFRSSLEFLAELRRRLGLPDP